MSENTTETVALPSAARVSRIEKILIAEPAIKAKIGKKEIGLKCRDGSTQKFAPEVIKVTQSIVEAGGEPFTAVKKDVLEAARKVLNIDGRGDTLAAVAPATEPAPAAPATAAADQTNASPKAPDSEPAANSKPSRKVMPDQTISIVALLLSAANIAEIGDSHPNAAERRTKLIELKNLYVEAANIRVS